MADPYVKQTWTDGSGGGTPISAARLAVMEQGIEDAHFKARAVCDTATAQSFTTSTVTIVRYDTEVEDPDNAVTTGAAWQYQAPVAGLYSVTAGLTWANSAAWSGTETTTLWLYKNGAAYRKLDFRSPTTATQFVGMDGAAFVRLAVNDTINIRAEQQTGGNLALHSDRLYNHVGIVMVSG